MAMQGGRIVPKSTHKGKMMRLRTANLDDMQAIGELFRAAVPRWQRMDSQGRVEDLPYEQLSVYDRWLHGGAWMSIETASIWLSHLLRMNCLPYLLEQGDRAVGFAELYPGTEPQPYGTHQHLGRLITQDAGESGRGAVLEALLEQLQGTITVSQQAYDEAGVAFYRRHGFGESQRVKTVRIPAQGGAVGFYKVAEHPNAAPAQIETWQMPIGRSQSARQHWEELWPQLWQGVPQIVARSTYRQRFDVAGQTAFVCVQQELYNPRGAEVYCWTPKALTSQLLNAIRDWSYKQGFRTLTLTMPQNMLSLLENAEATPHQHVILAREMG